MPVPRILLYEEVRNLFQISLAKTKVHETFLITQPTLAQLP